MSGREVLLVGLSHKSAPIDVRERVALSGDALKTALHELRQMDGVEEAFVVSTCNRAFAYRCSPAFAARDVKKRRAGPSPSACT